MPSALRRSTPAASAPKYAATAACEPTSRPSTQWYEQSSSSHQSGLSCSPAVPSSRSFLSRLPPAHTRRREPRGETAAEQREHWTRTRVAQLLKRTCRLRRDVAVRPLTLRVVVVTMLALLAPPASSAAYAAFRRLPARLVVYRLALGVELLLLRLHLRLRLLLLAPAPVAVRCALCVQRLVYRGQPPRFSG